MKTLISYLIDRDRFIEFGMKQACKVCEVKETGEKVRKS